MMRARMIGLVALTAVVTSTLVERPSVVAATTAQVYVTGYVDRGYTASGVYTHPGTCAVDPRVIPLGTYITIDGIGTCHAEDTGGAVIGYHIDVWVPTLAQAYALTGWHTATWGGDPSQQVLGYHAAASTATPTNLPTITVSATPPSATPSSLTTTPAAGAPTPLPATTGAPRRSRRTRDTHARHVSMYATPIPTSTAATGTTTPVAATAGTTTPTVGAGTTTPALDVVSTPTAIATPSGARQPRQTGCHTIRWTTYVGGYPYKHWRMVCH